MDPCAPTTRRGALTPVLARTAVRAATASWGSDRRRQRLRVRTSAEVLTARGLRVRVVCPPVAWPRGPRFVVADAAGWTDVLALATVVPGVPVVDAALAGPPLLRALARRGGLLVDDGGSGVRAEVTALLRRGVAVTAHPGGTAAGDGTPGRFRADAFTPAVEAQAAVCPVAVRRTDGDLVEVRLLPALGPGRVPGVLAALAEHALAHVLEATGPAVPIPPPPVRRRTVRARVGYGRTRPEPTREGTPCSPTP
ncbi:1-acyl-sn-glycerol-3-phosphate acyltransferase [Geodermatophilus bullaregiensis]|uniref:hypothetical protein n=1 Tax=Geodermatophilus bullaregiensis TaxID=1564160 RepID=UPI001956E59C|nr:hypothetical protein [Geodermatophilus bullaregiensis]MBM7806499.1 1-acyl-sn-glycerol-3-phosphate acyltransferase [Geodermatophilus bullaregiensis]